jgi:molybdopterin biosynthesis enzyme
MIDPDEALQLVLDSAKPAQPSHVPLDEACGLRLAETVRADRDYPPFARALIDGYAARCEDAGSAVEIVGQVQAGQEAGAAVRAGHGVEMRTRFVLARARPDAADSTGWQIDPLGGATSADLFTPSGANCYVRVPPGEGGLDAGATIPFVWIDQG